MPPEVPGPGPLGAPCYARHATVHAMLPYAMLLVGKEAQKLTADRYGREEWWMLLDNA